MFFCEYCEILKKIYFGEHQRTAASGVETSELAGSSQSICWLNKTPYPQLLYKKMFIKIFLNSEENRSFKNM